MFEDEDAVELMGQCLIWVLKWIAVILIFGITVKFVIFNFH